jgi:hypothetical protein
MLTPEVERAPGIAVGLTWLLSGVTGPVDSAGGFGRFGGVRASFAHGGAHMYGWHNDYRAWPRLDLAVAIATNHWRLPNDAINNEPSQIEGFITSWLEADSRLPEPDRSLDRWAWKTAYVSGLLYADQLTGQLGNPNPVTPAMIDAMITGARAGTAIPGGTEGWDPEAFRAGLEDMLAVGQRPDSIRARITSGRFRVSAAEIERIGKELGSSRVPLLAGPLQ